LQPRLDIMKSLHITYIGHATVLIEIDGIRILTDPVLRNRIGHIKRRGGSVDPAHHNSLDAVLISHMHLDHLDLPSLRLLGFDQRLIVPSGAGDLLHRHGFRNIEEVRAGEIASVEDITIAATVAHHEGARWPFGPEAETLGFLIKGGKTVYFAGDTDLFPEMAALASIDVALLPVWGWGPTIGDGHLTPRRAAESLQLLKPKAAMPIHWGTFAPMGLGWMKPYFLSEPPRDFAHHAGELAPNVDIHVVNPGNFLQLPS
jgi:L-ascorbate metabolism protein UlaG (beta-lactamase superfamily)